jgi:hypothetical protein
MGSSWDNNTLFGPKGDLLASVDAFAPTGIERVTLKLNSASVPDTLGTDSFFEVRGSVNGAAMGTLPDGHVLDWSESSTIEPKNTAGDYFAATFYAPAQTQVQFKFWSKSMEKWGTNGWEVGNISTNETGDMLLTVTQDTTLSLHFFNGLGDKKPYDWRPWEPVTNKIAVWFRVYMNTHVAVQKGYTIGKENPIIGIRGDELNNRGPLSWGVTKVKLTRELADKSRSGYHLFSGAAFFPKTLAGNTQKYKFFIESNGWEDRADRTFIIPASDTTLHWVYFSDSPPVQGQVNVENDPPSSASNFSLAQNFPNPFNLTTTISFSIPQESHVRLKIYDLLGREVSTLLDGELTVGEHKLLYSAKDIDSGIYFCRIEAQSYKAITKIILIK